jgi:ferric-dicitrate binding protein FerR (iron transport regulator)
MSSPPGGSRAPMSDPRDLKEPRALEPLALLDEASSADVRLGQALQSLYPRAPAPLPPGGWARLKRAARDHAGRRRRRSLARKLLVALGPRRVSAYAAASVLVLAALVVAARPSARPVAATVSKLLSTHAEVTGTDSAPRQVMLAAGAVIDVMGDASVDQTSAGGTRIALRTGAVHSTVPHLTAGQSFVVLTSTASVTVHGTRFTVHQTEAGRTSVSVEEGLVEVRPLDGHRAVTLLRPGESTVVEPFVSYFAALQTEVTRAVQEEDCRAADNAIALYLAAAPPTIDVSAAHYLDAVCAVQRGEREAAIKAFEKAAVTASLPTRADNALARAAQLRSAADARRGAAAWRLYLTRFPKGLHTQLAHQSLAGLNRSGDP